MIDSFFFIDKSDAISRSLIFNSVRVPLSFTSPLLGYRKITFNTVSINIFHLIKILTQLPLGF